MNRSNRLNTKLATVKHEKSKSKLIMIAGCVLLLAFLSVVLLYINVATDYRTQIQETSILAVKVDELRRKLEVELNQTAHGKKHKTNTINKSDLPIKVDTTTKDRLKNEALFQTSVPKGDKCTNYHLKNAVDLLNGKCDMFMVAEVEWIDYCCEVCNANEGCQGFTYIGIRKQCYLKSCTVPRSVDVSDIGTLKSYATTAWLIDVL